jgi:hypothetical protein
VASTPSLKENPQFGVGQFGANAAFDGLLGLRYSWGTTFGLVLPNIDKALAQLNAASGGGRSNLFGPDFNLFSSASLKMLEEIGHGLTHTQSAAAEKYITEAWAFEGIGAVIERQAQDALHVRQLITHKAQPREVIRISSPTVRAQLRPVLQVATHAEDQAQAAARKTRALETRVAALERQTEKPHSVAVPGIWPRIGGIERDLDRLKGRVGKLGKYASLAAFVALLAKALSKMGINYIRCSNVKRYGRNLCGMNPSLLSALLAESFLLAAGISFRQLVHEVLAVEDEIKNGIVRSIQDLKGITPISEGGYHAVTDGRS